MANRKTILMKTKIKLLQQLIALMVEINSDTSRHFCEFFLDYHSAEVFYYSKGFNGDKQDAYKVKLNSDTFGEQIDIIIDALKEKI